MFKTIQEVRKLEFSIINILQKEGVGALTIKEIKEKVFSSQETVSAEVIAKNFDTSFVKLAACGFFKDEFGNQAYQSDVLTFEKDSVKLNLDQVIMLDFKFFDLDWADFENSIQSSFAMNEPSSLNIIAQKHLFG